MVDAFKTTRKYFFSRRTPAKVYGNLNGEEFLFDLWFYSVLKELQCFKFNYWKKHDKFFFTEHQNNLIQSVENNNLTITFSARMEIFR